MIDSSRLLPHIVPQYADWRPAESMFRSDSGVFSGYCALLEGWGRSSLPPCFFFALSSLVFLKGALCSLPRPLAARPTANAKLSRHISFAGHRHALPIRCSERCTQKRLPSICWCLPPMHGPDRQMPCCPPAEAVRIFPRICALRKAAGLPARRATPMCIQGSIL